MNERIQELVFEAIDFKLDPDSKCYEAQVHPEDLEYLVELIIRECLEQIDTVRDGCDEDDDHQQALGAEWAGLAVAKHFGVNDE